MRRKKLAKLSFINMQFVVVAVGEWGMANGVDDVCVCVCGLVDASAREHKIEKKTRNLPLWLVRNERSNKRLRVVSTSHQKCWQNPGKEWCVFVFIFLQELHNIDRVILKCIIAIQVQYIGNLPFNFPLADLIATASNTVSFDWVVHWWSTPPHPILHTIGMPTATETVTTCSRLWRALFREV